MASVPAIRGPRGLPSVDRLLARAEVQALCERFGRAATVAALREEIAIARRQLLQGALAEGLNDAARLAQRTEAVLSARRRPSLVRVVNATGVVLHTNLGRAPLATAAAQAASAVASGYCNLEYDLHEGGRGSRADHVRDLLCRLTGAESALVVNNCAAAVLLALSAIARDGEVVASRGELVEIGGAFRIPEVVTQSGARLVEVGATNRTRIEDYRRAISPLTRALLKSHPSNYRIVGFTEAPGRDALAHLAHEHDLPLVEDLGSGTLHPLATLGLPAEPTVGECIAGGADVVCFSGDKLLGGPQAGIIVGAREWVEPLGRHPLMRALRIDKMTLAALEATLRIHESGAAAREIPVLRMLAQQLPALRKRARRAARALRAEPRLQCEVVEEASLPGGGALPLASLPTVALKLRVEGGAAAALARACLAQSPAVVGRMHRDAFLLDVRTVADDEVAPMTASVRAALHA